MTYWISQGNNKPRTESLFLELYRDEGEFVLYTLKNEDQEFNGKTIYSLRRLYLEISDPTEYEFANTCFANWDHWEQVANNQSIKPYIEKWRRELNIKMKSDAFKKIREEADTKGKNAFSANKYLIEKPWAGEDTKGSWKMGRPSKQAIKEEAARLSEQIDRIDLDLKRLNIN